MEPPDRLMGVHIRKVQETVASLWDREVFAHGFGLVCACLFASPRKDTNPSISLIYPSATSQTTRRLPFKLSLVNK